MWCSVLSSFFFFLCLELSTITHGSSLTRGFPSLEELKRYGSLLDRFSTHDGEIREVPGLTFNCPGQVQITKVTFIALPGPGEDDDGIDRQEIVVRIGTSTIRSFVLEHEMLAFGQFGYESSVDVSVNLSQSDVETPQLWITHPPYVNSTLRLLHQVGDEARNICWRYVGSDYQSLTCEQDFDYPLLAIETDPPGCIEGFVSAEELKRQWENRSLPVLYTSPEREISLSCPNSGSSTITQITVVAYQSMNGFNMQSPQITIYRDEGDISQECNVSTQPISEGVNVYECNIVDISVEEEITISVYQRNSRIQIGFLHDGKNDTPLIHIDGYCGSSQLLSAEKLVEKTQNHILNITERVIEDTYIEFPHLNITGDGQLVKWTFVARFAGMGQNYPQLSVFQQALNTLFPVTNIFIVENKNCTATVYPNVYECSVNQSVKAGDFVGLKLPAIGDAKLLLSFILNGAPPGISLTASGDGLIPGLPLISLEINHPVQRHTSSTHLFLSSTINLLPSSYPDTTTTTTGTMATTITDASGEEGVFVFAAVGCSVFLLMIVIFSTLLILILLGRKRKRKRNKSIDVIENTSYCVHHLEVRNGISETDSDVKPTSSHEDDTETLSTNQTYGTTITDNPAYDTTLSGDVSTTIVNDVTEVATTVNPAYTSTVISTNDNPAYDTTLSGDVSTTIANDVTEVATTVNPAYTSTVISTNDNPAYVPTESLVYDYARMQY